MNQDQDEYDKEFYLLLLGEFNNFLIRYFIKKIFCYLQFSKVNKMINY